MKRIVREKDTWEDLAPLTKFYICSEMFLKLVTLTLSVLPLIAGQDPAVQIEGIEAHFKQAALVPALLPSFNPTAVLSLNFPGKYDYLAPDISNNTSSHWYRRRRCVSWSSFDP